MWYKDGRGFNFRIGVSRVRRTIYLFYGHQHRLVPLCPEDAPVSLAGIPDRPRRRTRLHTLGDSQSADKSLWHLKAIELWRRGSFLEQANRRSKQVDGEIQSHTVARARIDNTLVVSLPMRNTNCQFAGCHLWSRQLSKSPAVGALLYIPVCRLPAVEKASCQCKWSVINGNNQPGQCIAMLIRAPAKGCGQARTCKRFLRVIEFLLLDPLVCGQTAATTVRALARSLAPVPANDLSKCSPRHVSTFQLNSLTRSFSFHRHLSCSLSSIHP